MVSAMPHDGAPTYSEVSVSEAVAPPGRAAVEHLRPGLWLAAAHTLGSAAAIAVALTLAARGGWLAYLGAQAILSLAFVHAFVLLHEAGHHTLFPVGARTGWSATWPASSR